MASPDSPSPDRPPSDRPLSNQDGTGYYRIALEAEAGALDGIVAVLETFAHAVSTFEVEDDIPPGEIAPHWRIEAICEGEPDLSALAIGLAEVSGRAGTDVPDFHVRPLEDVDWLARNRAEFPPVTVGRFFLHGTHFEGEIPQGKDVIVLDAGPAFGSGTHETTQGCLRAIESVLGQGAPEGALDLGCGSGILAIAIAKAGRCAVLASDNDAIAAETARANAVANGVGDRVTVLCAEGLADAAILAAAPFGLVVANILAQPLISLAPGIARALAPEGALILSGLLTRQEEEVLAAYRAEGLIRRRSIVLGDWSTLVLGRRPA